MQGDVQGECLQEATVRQTTTLHLQNQTGLTYTSDDPKDNITLGS